jgi:ADP-ribose pyrophosphatase YjhB (NUDIX family)
MAKSTRKRASAVLVKDGKILLIKRIKPERTYFVAPGGGIEEGEAVEEALRREVEEELSLRVKQHRLLFTLEDQYEEAYDYRHGGNEEEHYFLIEAYDGAPELSGPEKEHMSPVNQYELVWIDIEGLEGLENFYPKGIGKKIRENL